MVPAIVERMRPILLGLADRMLGSRAEAEDAVHDAFMKWQASNRSAIRNPEAWLTSACTRRCIDLLRAAGASAAHTGFVCLCRSLA
jgi:RNA polymerase sigma-70 factor (ECF subfamily)